MDEVYDGLSTQSAEELRMTPWPGRARWSRPGRTSQPQGAQRSRGTFTEDVVSRVGENATALE